MPCDFSGRTADLENEQKRISLSVKPTKSNNVNLESQDSSQPFPDINSAIL